MTKRADNPADRDHSATASTIPSGRSITRVVRRLGLTAAPAGLIVAAGFASEHALAAPFIVGSPTYDTLPGTLGYIGAVLALASIMGAVGAETVRGTRSRGFVTGLIAVSAAGILFFGLLSVLGAQFWAVSHDADSTGTMVTALLYFAAFGSPAVGTLASALLILRQRSRPLTVWVPSALVLGVVALSVVVVICFGL